MLQLAKNLASEWGQYGIRVNTISPGYIVTAMVEELFRRYPERRTDWPTQNMLGKLSKPEDFRGAAVFLLSPASSYMTGADMRIGTYNLVLTSPNWYRNRVVRRLRSEKARIRLVALFSSFVRAMLTSTSA